MNDVSTLDRPFALPPRELATVILDLPPPPSVNRTRKLDPRGLGQTARWRKCANNMVMAQGRRKQIKGRFEIHVTLAEHIKTDADNILKCLIDYLRHIEIITDDSPKYMRRIVVEFGHAPEGCRVAVQELA